MVGSGWPLGGMHSMTAGSPAATTTSLGVWRKSSLRTGEERERWTEMLDWVFTSLGMIIFILLCLCWLVYWHLDKTTSHVPMDNNTEQDRIMLIPPSLGGCGRRACVWAFFIDSVSSVYINNEASCSWHTQSRWIIQSDPHTHGHIFPWEMHTHKFIWVCSEEDDPPTQIRTSDKSTTLIYWEPESRKWPFCFVWVSSIKHYGHCASLISTFISL